jgi:hypothetical protein
MKFMIGQSRLFSYQLLTWYARKKYSLIVLNYLEKLLNRYIKVIDNFKEKEGSTSKSNTCSITFHSQPQYSSWS